MALLTEAARRAVLARVLDIVDRKFMGPEPDLNALRNRHERAILEALTTEQLEQALTMLLRDLGTSHVGCFHESKPRAPGRIAIAATFASVETVDGRRWMFQDVHHGGVAAAAGFVPGDVLLTIDGKEFTPPNAIPFALGQSYAFTVRKSDGRTTASTLTIPGSKEKQRPIVVPDQIVTASTIGSDIGLIRVSMFPGVLGIRLLCPSHLVKARDAYLAAFRQELATPLRPSTAQELRWLFEHQAAPPDALSPESARFARARQAFASPRYRVLYRAWLREGARVVDSVVSPVLADAIREGTADVEWHVLPHQYLRLSSLVGTA